MQEKYFLFQREDPSIFGGLSFSDNGNGISVLAIPASNVAYMTADKEKVVVFFNDSSMFEESGLVENGESFEKTNVSVTCELGKEVELIEAIINFINRATPNNFMRFDATGERNTFNQTTSTPIIQAKVRSKATKRGFTGNESIVKGILPPAVLGGVDFLSEDRTPIVDIDGGNITDNVGRVITSIRNTGNAVDSAFSYEAEAFNAVPEVNSSDVDGPGPICFAADAACFTKTIGFQSIGSLVPSKDVKANVAIDSALDAGATAVDTVFVSFNRSSDSEFTFGDLDLPTLKITTDSGGTVAITAATVNYEGTLLEAGDVLVFIAAGGVISYTVGADDIGSGAKINVDYSMLKLGLLASGAAGAPYVFSLSDYTLYLTIVLPNGALLSPLYGALHQDSSQTQGPFPVESLGNEFQLTHGGKVPDSSDAFTSPSFSPAKVLRSKKESFGTKNVFNDTLSSEENLFTFVVRRTKKNDIYVYDREGDLLVLKENDVDTDGVFDFRKIGLITSADLSQPQPRIARFGVINKDVGDDHARNIAVQLDTKYQALI